MKRIILLLSVLASLATGLFAQQTTPPPLPLMRLRPSFGNFDWIEDNRLSMHGMVFSFGIKTGFDSDDYAIYNLEKKYTDFVFAAGFGEGMDSTLKARIVVWIDGDVVETINIDTRAKPFRKIIDVKGKRSLKIAVLKGACVGEPFLYFDRYKTTDTPTNSGGTTTTPNATITTDSFIEDEKVKLRWEEVKGATSYAVVVYLVGGTKGSENERVWSFTKKNRHELDVDLAKLPKGKFEWEVQALNDSSKVGTRITGKPFQIGS